MIKIAQIQLQPDERQFRALRDTMREANNACNEISSIAFEGNIFHQFRLHKAAYYWIRAKYSLSAQVVVRCIAKVADSYKKDSKKKEDQKTKRTYKPLGAIAYDDRILSYRMDASEVSIWTIQEREKIPYVLGVRQEQLLAFRKGESDLCLANGKFFLNVACELREEEQQEPEDLIGVDLGIRRLATTSEGIHYIGDGVERKRQWYLNRRRVLQKVGTKSAKRRLKKLAGRERRFRKTRITVSVRK